jgi:hypothetical protein
MQETDGDLEAEKALIELVGDPTSKRPASSGADERRWPLASTRSDLPQHAVTQERGVALTLVGKADKLLREELFFASSFVGQVENFADAFERR